MAGSEKIVKNYQVYGPKLHPWQTATVRLFRDHPRDSVIVIKSPRQRGKTHTLINLVLDQAINRKRHHTIIICPTYQICHKQYRELEDMLVGIPGLLKGSNSSFFEFTLYNKSLIELKSAESGNNLRGNTCDLLIFDEGAFISMQVGMECMNFVNTTHGNVIIASTPKFRDENDFFYSFYKQAVDKKPGVHLIDFNDYDTSIMMPPERLEMYRRTMPYNIFLNEILGEFLETTSSLWDFGKVLKNGTLPDGKLYAGIDFATGSDNDETAIVLFNSQRQMVQLIHFNDKDSLETVRVISALLEEQDVARCVIEMNSIGKTYRDLLRREVKNRHIPTQIVEFNTTNDSKRDIIEDMQVQIQNQAITLLDDQALKLEFAGFTIKKTPTGKITYGNSSDNIHDDIVMATALALHAFRKSTYNIR